MFFGIPVIAKIESSCDTIPILPQSYFKKAIRPDIYSGSLSAENDLKKTALRKSSAGRSVLFC